MVWGYAAGGPRPWFCENSELVETVVVKTPDPTGVLGSRSVLRHQRLGAQQGWSSGGGSLPPTWETKIENQGPGF